MVIQNNNIETLEKIVDSAILLFNQHGFSGASISEISKHAGLSKGILYYYFKNKDELYLHCAKKCIDDFRKYLTENIKENDNDEDNVLKLLQLRLSFFDEYPKYRTFFLNILAKNPDHLSTELSELSRDFRQENLKVFMRYLNNIPFGKGVTKEDVMTFISVLQSHSTLTMEAHNDIANKYEQGNAILKMARIYINGLKTDLE